MLFVPADEAMKILQASLSRELGRVLPGVIPGSVLFLPDLDAGTIAGFRPFFLKLRINGQDFQLQSVFLCPFSEEELRGPVLEMLVQRVSAAVSGNPDPWNKLRQDVKNSQFMFQYGGAQNIPKNPTVEERITGRVFQPENRKKSSDPYLVPGTSLRAQPTAAAMLDAPIKTPLMDYEGVPKLPILKELLEFDYKDLEATVARTLNELRAETTNATPRSKSE